MVSQIKEGYYTGEFLSREGPGYFSRDVVLFDNTGGASDLLVPAGTVYSLESPGSVTVQAKAGNTGNGTVSAVSVNTLPVQIGTYLVTMTGATTFGVTAPDGSVLSNGSSAAAYVDGIGFKYTAGGTPNAAGDTYSIAIAIGAAPVVTAGGSNVGNGTIGNVEVVQNAPAQTGNYVLVCTTAGASAVFSVTAPDGRALPPLTVGVPYEDELAFSITGGGTNYAVGDTITLGVGLGAGYATFFTGAAPAAGIIWATDYVPAGTTKKLAAIVRHAEVIGSALQYPTSGTAAGRATLAAQLATKGIIVR